MIRKFFLSILILMLIALCAYNNWQLRQVQDQVGHLQRQLSSDEHKQPRTTELVLPPADHSGWLDLAKKHLDLAQAAASQADFGTARKELALSMHCTKEAAAEPEVRTESGIKDAHRRLLELKSQANSLVKQLHLGQ
jgi:predicted negative regulator of RcsB-dependent stress response